MNYIEGSKVTVWNLGSSFSDRTFRGIIKGLSSDGVIKIWIVEMIDRVDFAVYPYSHCTFPEGCLRPEW